MRNFPRVLIINSEPLHSKSATGLTMMSLFTGWPKDKIAQIYIHPVVPDSAICENTRRVSIRLVKVSYAIKKFSIQSDGNLNKCSGRKSILKVSECSGIKPGFKYRLKDKIVPIWRQVAFLMPYKVSDELLSWIEVFKPDVIYSMLYDIDIMSLVIKISDRFLLPVVPHFMDDWPSTLNRRNIFYRLLEHSRESKLKEVVKRSPFGLVIGDAMAVEFKKRYHTDMYPFMYCVEPAILKKKMDAPNTNKTVRFIYIGGLHLHRWESLREIGMAMAELAADGVKIECLIYAHHFDVDKYSKILTIPNIMKIVGSLDHDEVHHAQASADCLIHVESFYAWDKSFTQLSVSSKIPEYLAAGRPIFAYGPKDVASIQYIDEIGCGFIVGQKDPTLLKQKIKEAATLPDRRNTLGNLAFEASKVRHDATKQREKFRKIVSAACNVQSELTGRGKSQI